MYQLRRPDPKLARFIEHYWFVTSDEGPVDLRVEVFVDARADLIFNAGAPYVRSVIGGERRDIASSNLDAQRRVPIRIEQRGHVRTTGVRFHVGGLAPFASAPLQAFTDRTVAPEEVLGAAVTALDRTIRETSELDEQARALDSFFLGALEPAADLAAFWQAVDLATETRGAATVEQMAEAARLSVRHLERLFARHLGLTPKTLARVLRFQSALGALMRESQGTLAEVAARAGYFDQAHFIKDFRRMTGGVPRGYRGYYPPKGPHDFAPNVVVFLQDVGASPS